jgi:hypothetical protein
MMMGNARASRGEVPIDVAPWLLFGRGVSAKRCCRSRKLPADAIYHRRSPRLALVVTMVGLVAACGVAQPPTSAMKASLTVRATPVSRAPSTRLVVLRQSTLLIIDADTGAIVRTVMIHGSTSNISDPVAALSVTPSGNAVYLERWAARRCQNSAIVKISLITGKQTTVITHAMDPALSPNGKLLAYAATAKPPADFPDWCATGRTYVRNLVTGVSRSWAITTHPRKNRSREFINDLVWAPDGNRLAVGNMLGPPSLGIQLLNPDAAQSSTNPRVLPARHVYDSPVILSDGNIMGILDSCPDAASCGGAPPDQNFTTVSVLNSRTGRVVSTIRPRRGVCALAVDPSGRRIGVIVCTRTHPDLYRLVNRRLALITKDIDAAAWLPARQ